MFFYHQEKAHTRLGPKRLILDPPFSLGYKIFLPLKCPFFLFKLLHIHMFKLFFWPPFLAHLVFLSSCCQMLPRSNSCLLSHVFALSFLYLMSFFSFFPQLFHLFSFLPPNTSSFCPLIFSFPQTFISVQFFVPFSTIFSVLSNPSNYPLPYLILYHLHVFPSFL